MAVERRFLIAPSFARLLRRESEHTSRIMEGYFPSPQDECRFIRIEPEQAALILARRGGDEMMLEEAAVIPHRQAEALMNAIAGTAAFDRMIVPIGGDRVAVLDHFLTPSGLNVLTIAVEGLTEPPAWFGPEITHQPEFDTNSLALKGRPSFREVEITNHALLELPDALEDRGVSRSAHGRSATSDAGAVTSLDQGSDITGFAPVVAERTSVTGHDPSVEPVSQRAAERSGTTPKHLRRLEGEARRAAFRESTSESDEGAARIARSLAPYGPPPR